MDLGFLWLPGLRQQQADGWAVLCLGLLCQCLLCRVNEHDLTVILVGLSEIKCH